MKPESCPDPEELRSFVRCSVSEQQADRISEHLDHCPACEETVVGLERDGDTIADRIKQAAAQPTFAQEPECQQLMQSLLDGADRRSAEPSSADAPVQVSEILRDYKIVAKLGEGGMGTVYKAVHQRLKKTVALKVLPTNRIGDPPAVARFEREMEVLGQLNHPHIVQAFDAGEHEGQHYLVMEYVEGCNLSDIVKRFSPLSVADACLLISQAAAGLQYAHENGFVHRDIKPSNLMLATGAKTGTPIVKILDLGLARALDQRPDAATPKPELTTTGQVMGTLDYMAPEQGGDAHQVDIRADIYSLGATLYKLLTGDSPYAEHAQKPPLQRMMAIAHHEPPAIRTKRREIPEKLAVIVHRMLAKKPEQRFGTPAEVVQALAPFCAKANLTALVIPNGETRVLDASADKTTRFSAASDKIISRRGRYRSLAGIVAFVALATVIVISTRTGTVEVTSPNGGLPKDVKVVVSRGGDEVEVLQADNHWSAKIVNGEYTVALRGGNDRFTIEDSKLTVSRMGRSAVVVQLRKLEAVSNGPTVATIPAKPEERLSATEPGSAKVPVAVDSDKPIVISDSPCGLEFDGQDDYVAIPEFQFDPAKPLSVEVWFETSARQIPDTTDLDDFAEAVIAWWKPNKTGFHFAIDRRNDAWNYVFHDGRDYHTTWFWFARNNRNDLYATRHHAALVSDGLEIWMYVDGKHRQSVPSKVTTGLPSEPAQDTDFMIGATLGLNGKDRVQFFKGRIEQVRVSKSMRYKDEFIPPIQFQSDSETIALYAFDEGQGVELHDTSGNGHHGRIVGAKWVVK